jgi:predicted nucleic acid-binding protein
MNFSSIVISDTSPIISLAVIDQLSLLLEFFGNVYIPQAVWEELLADPEQKNFSSIKDFFADNVRYVSHFNELRLIMDAGESEAIQLYRECEADFLLIDDKRAREIAESLGVKCIGTLALLIKAKRMGKTNSLRTLFLELLKHKRYFSKELLNLLLQDCDEPLL